ncbi:hypothetical protein FACS1894180_0850 [Bacteroidia bacterium]|nr:hypothetical protein FACS1894180_0850 [Bacteroidia bacterium]
MKYLIIISLGFLMACSYQPVKNQEIQHKTIDVFEDDKRDFTFVYNEQDLLIETILYNTHTDSIESKSQFHYQNGIFDYVSQNSVKDIDYTQDVLNYLYQRDYLISKGINFQHPEIISSEISDISNVLSVAENYDDFKTDSIINGSKKTVKFIGFNKNIRFYPSYITMFIPDNTFIIDYEYTVNKNHLETEKYILDDGTLLRTYFYDKERVIKVEYLFTEKESGETFSFEKRFEYSPIFSSL